MSPEAAARVGLVEAVAIAGVVQGLFLAFVLWTQERGDRTQNRLLAGLMGLYSLHLLHIVLYWSRLLGLVPHVWGTVWLFPYLYGALLHLYTRRWTAPREPLIRRDALHFLPFVFFVLLFGRFYLLPGEIKTRMLEASYTPTPTCDETPNLFLLAAWGLQFVHFLAYFLSSRRLLEGSSKPEETLWLRRLSAGFAISFSLWFGYGLAVSTGVTYSRTIDYAATLAMTLSIYAAGYTALRVPEIFVGSLARARRIAGDSPPLSDDQLDTFRSKLEVVMKNERPYVDANLRLVDLASLVEVTPHELSRVLNQGLGLRFNDFVNRYRVEEAKRLMTDPSRREASILELAFASGFNNKTSFNEAFKKYTRMTPSRFRDQISRQSL